MTSRCAILLPILLSLSGPALAADPPLSPAQAQAQAQNAAIALYNEGKHEEALHAFEAIIATKSGDLTGALFGAGLIDIEDNNWQAARPYVQQLVNLRPASFDAWELMIQIDQAAGKLDDRESDIQALYTAWRSALEPQIKSKVAFVRDRLFGPKHTLIAQETLEPGGDNITRFVFVPVEEIGKVHHALLVRSDSETNDRWREEGTVPSGAVIYHLDSVEQRADGQQAIRTYKFWVEPPDYDEVRTKVMEILAGTVQPLSGGADQFWASAPAK